MARDKIFYLFACSCGYGLGKDLVAAGARAFFGYTDRYTILDREWKVFCDCAIAVDLALLAGKTCAEAHGEAIAKYNQEISRFRANQDQNAAKVLERNRNLLVSPVTDRAYGDPNARLETGMATMT